jgi:hypothetical protein
MKKARKAKNKAWFTSVRKSYLPASWQGLCIYTLYVAYSIAVPVIWYNNGHDMSKLVTNVIPLVVAATLLTQFIASKNSK